MRLTEREMAALGRDLAATAMERPNTVPVPMSGFGPFIIIGFGRLGVLFWADIAACSVFSI